MDVALTLFLGVAVWRATHIIWQERGPLDIFTRFRAYLAKKQKHMGGFFDMVNCFNCLSIWISVIPAAALAHNFVTLIGFILILSAEAIFLNQLFDKKNV